MNLNSSIRYQLYDNKRPIAIFYTIAFVTSLIMILLVYFPNNPVVTVKGRMGGLEVATTIFLFVAGMNSFRENFRMFVQNGVSRRTLFIGRLITVSIISLGMAMIDNVIAVLFRKIIPANDRMVYKSTIEIMYGSRYESHSSGALMFVEGILIMFCLYVAVSMMGYFITTLYHRMNKAAKIAVSVGIPVGLFTVLPIVDSLVFNGAISRAFESFIYFAFGYSNGANPYCGALTLILTFAVFSGLSWLLVRKAVVKD